MDILGDLSKEVQDFAQLWKAADKIVYSRTLDTVSSKKTRLERDFDPQAIRKLKSQSTRDIAIGGPNLAAQAIRAGLVDEYQLCIVPTMIGGGIPVLPSKVSINLDLLDERRFGEGWVYARYRTRAQT